MPFFSGTASASSTRRRSPSGSPRLSCWISRTRQNWLVWTKKEIKPLSQWVKPEVSNAMRFSVDADSSSRRRSAAEGTSRLKCQAPENLISNVESLARVNVNVPCSVFTSAAAFTSSPYS